MFTNGRSFYFISTRSPKQRELWQRLFGVDTLPVQSPYPHEAMNENGVTAAFYTLDASRMTAPQIHSLAAYVVGGIWGKGYVKAVERIVADGWNIDGMYCELLETAESEKRPSLSVWGRFRQTAPGYANAEVGRMFVKENTLALSRNRSYA